MGMVEFQVGMKESDTTNLDIYIWLPFLNAFDPICPALAMQMECTLVDGVGVSYFIGFFFRFLCLILLFHFIYKIDSLIDRM